MRRQGFGLVTVLTLLTLAGGRGAYAAEPPTIIVTIQSFTGAPPDSASRKVFMNAFEQAFDADEQSWEKRTGESWGSSGERRNRFRLVDVAAPEDAWTLDVTIGLPPPVVITQAKLKSSDPTPKPRATDYRASRGLTIVAAATAPVGASAREAGEPLKFSVYFPDAKRVVVPSYKLPGGAYAYPWEEAGRVVALAALEVLHRANDTLSDDERADLAPAVRTEDTP
ncbi:MAG TPA: hypothetical protein VN896_09860 [Methylomirabilota bacterium]|jgi:hypothetical protein|nr:hypothetical protein [Methylomirabilota bacterium]